MLKLLYKGILIRDNDRIKKASSSVTYIGTKKHNIIVDTSSKDNRELIIEELKKLGLKPADIDIVINTHSHHDHVGNNDLFNNAEFINYSNIENLKDYENQRLNKNSSSLRKPSVFESSRFCSPPLSPSEAKVSYKSEGFVQSWWFSNPVGDEIEIIKTPGHTPDSISVIYKEYIVVGDAAPLKNNILKNIPPKLNYDAGIALASLRRIKSIGKNIVTGHEGIVYRDEYIK
uniref:MBL fold metallo-hydrolase n=2 Tax=Methanococcaceae TaxID=2183 RepID=UPI0021DF79BA|nr:MBL fold metallo-hydrolase [Methanothermococcus thermolithotrophicus]